MPDQARFLDFMDMIDGGGKGRMGDKFEGGGIFSALANLIATPYGSEDAGRRASREAAYRAAGLLAPEEAEAAPAAAPAVRRTKPTRAELMSARAAEMERQRGLQQDVFDPRGPNQMPAVTPVPAIARELTGSADMPPELLPMNTPRRALDTLFDRSVAQGYQGADMPSYIAEKRLIEMAEFPDSKYTDLDKINYASLMPPSLMRQPAGTPTAPYEQTGAVTDVRFGPPATPSPMLDQRQQAPAPNEARALQAIADNNMMGQFMNLQPYQQRAMIETMLQRGY